MTMGALLRNWRARTLLTQEQLAERSGLNVRTIRRLESDEGRRPRSASMLLLAEALDLDPGERKQLVTASRAIDPDGHAVPGDRAGLATGAAPADRAAPGSPAAHAAPVGDPSSAGVPPSPLHEVPRQLPPGAAHFVGRGEELGVLDGVLAERGVVCVVGAAGVGKSALALAWCASVAHAFPGGQLHLDLAGFAPGPPLEPARALGLLLLGLGVAAEHIPDDPAAASALWRSRTANRALLVLLDNARDSEQVRPLLPSPGCVAVVTSRSQLRSLAAREATARLTLAPLHPAESAELLRRVSGDPALVRERLAVRRLADLCEHSPLALRIVGERLARRPGTPLPELVAELGVARDFSTGEDAGSDLATVLSWSFASLGAEAARLLRAIARIDPRPLFTASAIAAPAALPPRQAERHLDRLVALHLLERHGPDRYFLPALVREALSPPATGRSSW
ncbi:helix-turn-helix domain-containing protein [Nonomuraea sp. NBC_01738]|uniref:helix-turn-helix transcriptional regulator n=1 Tax=Nonomuraea sp. NBC_01738 TaxID=2976003 RepID=UPI002E0DE322|nr:helix-turn-helix domain-containing protein [Nonomuraea sp. NBC_01738]